jgi:hypothetical protein
MVNVEFARPRPLFLQRLTDGMVRRERAQSVTRDFEGAIESRAEILERDCRRQLDDLFRIEEALDFLIYRI